MAVVGGFSAINDLSSRYYSPSPCIFLESRRKLVIRTSIRDSDRKSKPPGFRIGKRRPGVWSLESVHLGTIITSDDEDEMSEGFFEAIEELERMAREPSDVLEEMNDKLSNRELQLVLVYFSQEGRDSWFTLEVFEWLKKENKVDQETMELMVSIMCNWMKKLIEAKNKVQDVVDLLVDMDCVGLEANFSMIEKVISLYWEAGEKQETIAFVKEVLRRGISSCSDEEGDKTGPVGYLAWKMMEEGSCRDAAKLVLHFRDCGLKPDIYSYLIAMTGILRELNEFAKSMRSLNRYTKSGLVSELDANSVWLAEKYQQELLDDGLLLSAFALEERGGGGDPPSPLREVVRKRLLAMHVVAGRGTEAERLLSEKNTGSDDGDDDLCNVVLAICASQKESVSVSRLLTRMEGSSPDSRRKTLTWLLRGYVKGGHFRNAGETLVRMVEAGVLPEFTDRVAVLQGLGRRIRRSGYVDTYLDVCRCLADVDLISPSLVYVHLRKHKLWIISLV
ncbi:hypothetical protein M569_04522 [Genlisea aurea]|uniref:Pentacotripeptide-repeat region of PRORP domain-containing protein n=1 Tax=Genlisea aurea TaxID=192259 RepID=S8E3F7_9LAMI|nr:hypothetical protein M569_04522 [Genlisea aurea]